MLLLCLALRQDQEACFVARSSIPYHSHRADGHWLRQLERRSLLWPVPGQHGCLWLCSWSSGLREFRVTISTTAYLTVIAERQQRH